MQTPAIGHAANSEFPKAIDLDKPSSKAPQKQDHKIKELMKHKLKAMNLPDEHGRPLSDAQIDNVMSLQPLYFKRPPTQAKFHEFSEKESKWLLDMYQRRSLDNGLDFLSLWGFDLFELSQQLVMSDPSWKKWQQILLSHIASAYLSLSLSRSDIQHAHYTRGDNGVVGNKLPSYEELSLCFQDLRIEGEKLSQKAAELERFDKKKWTIITEGLDLGKRLFLNSQVRSVVSDKSLHHLAEQFKNSHLIKKEGVQRNIEELFRYIIFVSKLSKSADKRYRSEAPYFEELAKMLNALSKQPISQASLQEFRQVLVRHLINSEKVIAGLSNKRDLARTGILNKKNLKGSSPEEYLQSLDKQFCSAHLMQCFLLDVNRFFAEIAHSALPHSYVDGNSLRNRINVNLAVSPEKTAKPYLDLFTSYFPESSQLPDGVSLKKEMNTLLLRLIIECRGVLSLDQLSQSDKKKI